MSGMVLCTLPLSPKAYAGRASIFALRSSGRRNGWCLDAGIITGSTSPAGTRCAQRGIGLAEADDALDYSERQPGFRDAAQYPKARRMHATAHAEQQQPGPSYL